MPPVEPPRDATGPNALVNDYIRRRDAGDHELALEAAEHAVRQAPTFPKARYALGEALSALGRYSEAVPAFAAALHLEPNWPDAWINLGLARYRQGAVGHAKTAMRQALAFAPGHPAATANLAALMRITGETEAAESLLWKTVAEAPENLAARLNLVAELLQLDRPAEAMVLLDGAPSPPADLNMLRNWHLARALALIQARRLAAAKEALADLAALGPLPPELVPLWHWRRVLLADAMKNRAEAEAAARQMAAAIETMGPQAVPEHRLMAHYDLARFWSGRGEMGAAFAHWGAGHALLRLSQPFSRSKFVKLIDALIENFDSRRFASGPRARNGDTAPVFIVGMPRSGTTLCEQILAAHRQVHGAGERSALSRMTNRLAGSGGPRAVRRLAGIDGEALDQAAGEYLAALHALAPDKTRIVDKMPGNELYLCLVALMLPGARIIYCVRDPRDIGFSIWTFRFHGEHPYAHDLGDLGFTIAQRHRLMTHWRATLPNPILTVALSDWVGDFDGTLARVLTHLDLPPDPACARFYEIDRDVRTVSRAQVRKPVNARGIGRWRPHARELAPLIAELDAAGMLAEWDAGEHGIA